MNIRLQSVVVLTTLWATMISARHVHHVTHNATQQTDPTENDKIYLAKQLIQQQFSMEQIARSQGHSGIKVMRSRTLGSRPYHSASHSDATSIQSIHNHPNFYHTCGMGEVSAMLNGVEFTTRHNDFVLEQPGDHTTEYGTTETIPYPPVPQSVLEQKTLQGQMNEMKAYFKAWKTGDINLRNYTEHFKPALCYMEAAWTHAAPHTIQEPFYSERHWLAAKSWDNLFQKMRFTAHSGAKENHENFAHLPRVVYDVTEDGEIVFGQWNYRILCHPIDMDISPKQFSVIDDLKARLPLNLTVEEFSQSRNARFRMNDVYAENVIEGIKNFGIMDQLMEQIPGMDGYGAVHHDDSFGYRVKHHNSDHEDPTQLNTANYHRWYKLHDGHHPAQLIRHRGFNDDTVFMAMNDRDHVLPSTVEDCQTIANGSEVCQTWKQKWSYAIPLEIVYLTPLANWNPYDISYKGNSYSTEGRSIYLDDEGGATRDGKTRETAYKGTNSAAFFMTPEEFFNGPEVEFDLADTTAGPAYVLDNSGQVRYTRGSGMRMTMPPMSGVGPARLRYPISPVYGEGSPSWMEIEALKDLLIHPERFNIQS